MAEEKQKTKQEKTAKPGVITIKKDDLWKYSTLALAAVLVIVLIVFLVGKSPTGGVIADNPGTLPSPTAEVNVDIGDSPVKGDANAPVTLVEFTDYQCPFCQRHFQQTYPSLMQYVESGDVKIVIKEFPLNFHPEAQKAAEAAHCVRDQKGDEGYFMMHDTLFDNQQILSTSNYKTWARELGVNGAQFDTCLDSGKFASDVKADLSYGQQVGVSGTPGFFILDSEEKKGKIISGACPANTFTQAINAELEGNDWSVTNCQFTLD